MPRTKKRKTHTKKRTSGAEGTLQGKSEQIAPAREALPPIRYAGGIGPQNILSLAMVALGFLGLTIFFAFFYGADPNHYIYAALAGLTGIGWIAILARRWLQLRQRA